LRQDLGRLECVHQHTKAGDAVFFKKKVDAVEMGSELARLYAQSAVQAMFAADNVIHEFALGPSTYNPLNSDIPYPLFS
jgi:hypothetical protein